MPELTGKPDHRRPNVRWVADTTTEPLLCGGRLSRFMLEEIKARIMRLGAMSMLVATLANIRNWTYAR